MGEAQGVKNLLNVASFQERLTGFRDMRSVGFLERRLITCLACTKNSIIQPVKGDTYDSITF